ncbi:AlpA family phage regulatory protein [Polynucleobacter sp. Nonnen-W13]|nr:AlpA family phage regulatory protein [Polynucleobacter sp. Nonnen-W13]
MSLLFSLISKSDIRSEFGISKSTLDRWIKLHLWPKPIRIGGTALWRRADIENFLERAAQDSRNMEVL